jgi:hypothetical protein
MGASSFGDLIQHVNHRIQCTRYGTGCKKNAKNVSVECITCGEVLMDFDRKEKESSGPKKANILKWADPRYKDLRCECGNTTEFDEFALRETTQSFVVKGDMTDFEDYDMVRDTVFPTSIECASCGTVVWSAEKQEDANKQKYIKAEGFHIALDGGDWINVTLNGKSGVVSSSLGDPGGVSQVMHPEYYWGMRAIESLVLAHACAGIDVADHKYIEGIQTAIEALGQ